MAVLLFFTGRAAKVDKAFKADASAIDELQDKVEQYRAGIMRIPNMADTMKILGIGFGITGLSHFLADYIAPWIGENYPALEKYSLTSGFFWIVVIATTGGLLLSFTKYKQLEGAGASRLGSAMLYVLVATIGTMMDVTAIFEQPQFFLIGLTWMLVHVSIMLLVAWLIKAPFFSRSSWLSSQCRRSGLCTDCSLCFQSFFGSSGCLTGSFRLCDWYLWSIYLWFIDAVRFKLKC